MSVYQSNIIEMIEGMQEIKLTNSEKQKRWQWENIQTQIFEIKQKSLSLEQVQQIGSVFIMEIINVVVTVISVTSVIKGIISLGTMLSIQYIMGQIQTPVNQLVNIIQQIQNAKISMNRLSEIHNSNDEQQPNKYKEIKGTESIKIEKITFSYGSLRSKNVIDGISFSIPAGKMTAIVGLSGSGKTTLIKLILGFYPVNSGKIFIGNNQISDYSFKKWRQHCGVVMQDGFIFSDTIANNITIGDMTPDMEKLKIVADITNVSKFAENFPLGYKTIIGDSGMGLSQGQKQRILLARAIYNNPDYLFLDEATNALDAINEKDILLKLKSFCKNKTMIIVAHRLSTVKQADNIIVLENGKIVEQGKHIELINHQRIYFNLIKDQLNISK